MAFVVPWESFLRSFEPQELTDPLKVVSSFTHGNLCRLCEKMILGSTRNHVSLHADDLKVFLAVREEHRQKELAEEQARRRSEREETKQEAVQWFLDKDTPEHEIAEFYGIKLATLKSWVRAKTNRMVKPRKMQETAPGDRMKQVPGILSRSESRTARLTRESAILYNREDATFGEIAEALDVTVQTVCSHLGVRRAARNKHDARVLYERGLVLGAIADELGLSERTVIRHLSS